MAKGLVLQPQVSNPIPGGMNGVWVNNSNQMMFTDTSGSPSNISQGSSGLGTYVPMINNSGSTILKGSPVSMNTSGELQLVDVSVPGSASKISGVAADNIPNGSSGLVCVAGVIADLSTSLNFGDAVFAGSTAGTITGDEPQNGVDGFVVDDYVIRLGVIIKNPTVLTQKDLIVNFYIVGTL